MKLDKIVYRESYSNRVLFLLGKRSILHKWQKKKIAGSNPRRGFYLLILVCFFSVQHSYVTLVVLVSAR